MQLDRSEAFGLILALGVGVGAVVYALTQSPPAQPAILALPPAPESIWKRAEPALLVELPDSGGYLANGRALDPRELTRELQEIISWRPWYPHGLFVRMGPHRPAADLQVILQQAASAGWQVFAPYKGGPPVVVQPSQVPRGP